MAIRFLNTVQVDTDVLYVDAANDRVGIGTAGPAEKLEVAGTGELSFKINNTQYSKSLTIAQGGGYSHLKTSHSSGIAINYGQGDAGILSLFNGTTQAVKIHASSSSYFNGGNVGIGTTSPGSKLEISSTSDALLELNGGAAANPYMLFAQNGTRRAFIQYVNGGLLSLASEYGDIRMMTGTGGTEVERMRINASGNVGIGTTSPGSKLEVSSGAGANGDSILTISADTDNSTSSSSPKIVMSQKGGTKVSVIEMDSSNRTSFSNVDGHYFNGGNVGIGTTSPGDKLQVNGTVRSYAPTTSDWGFVGYNSAGNAPSGLWFDNGDGELLLRDDSGNLNIKLRSDQSSYINGGNLGIGTTAPDAKLTVFRTDSTYAISRGDVSTRAGLSVKSSSTYDSKLNFATGLNSQQYIQGLNNAATTGRPIVLNPYGGYVGINTPNLPTQQLDIISGTNNGIRISATDTTSTWRDIGIRSYVTEAEANALSDHTFIYTTNPSSGTEDPFGKFGATVIQGRDNGNSGFAIRLGNGGGHATRMWMGATGVTVFSNTVTATNFILSSDKRLKENIEEVCDNRVKADWKTFELKTEKGQKRYGVIAQELEKTNPEFIREDSQGFKSVAYIDLLIAKIAELEARLEKLEK